jgi:general secretion pathway protein G
LQMTQMNKWQDRRENRFSSWKRSEPGLSAGFTLIELMIVMTIIFILLGIAAAQYRLSLVRAHEAVLKSDLKVLREAIDNYTVDKETAPQSLEDLVSAHYMHEVPKDPMTGAADWQPVSENVVLSPDQSGTGITDVHSNSDKVSPFDQSPYNTW